MFNIDKRIICPQCGKTLGYRQEEYKREELPAWGQKDYVESDFVCSDCRHRMEELVRKRAEKIKNEI